MDNPRPEKVAVVEEVRERISSSDAVLLTEYRGLKVSELAELRRTLRANGGDYKVYKNTLVRFATADLDGVEDMLTGPTALAFVDGDAAAVAKTLRDYGRTNPNLVLKGGILGGKALSADDARALAELPPRDVLLARIAGGFAAPLQQFAGLLQALPRNLAYGLKALIDQRGEAGEPAAPAAPPAADEPVADAPAVVDEPAAADEIPEAAPAAEDTTTEETPNDDAPAPTAEAETAEEA
jgi:large subunit ribosomal protein L10